VRLTVYGDLVPVGGVGAAGLGEGNGSANANRSQMANGDQTVSGNQTANGNLTIGGKGSSNITLVALQGDGKRGREVTWLGLLLGAMGLLFCAL
jgi:hypothetical protein